MGKTRDTANLISDGNIFVDITNDRVGIGTTNPNTKLDVSGIGQFTSNGATLNLVGTDHTYIQWYPDGIATGRKAYTGFPFDSANYFEISNNINDGSGNIILTPGTNASVLINTNLSYTYTATGTASQPLQVTGGAYVSGNIGIGTTRPTSKFHVVGGDSDFEGVIETVSVATTYMVGNGMVLEMDVRRATVYTYTMPTGANIGIVSFKNMPAQTGSPSGSTVTLLVTQNAAGTGNTTAATGIGTNCTIVGYENNAPVAGISTRGLIGSATTVTLSTTGSDIDFVSFFINYNGGTNTTASNYKVYITKNGGFRRGTVGV